MKRVTSISPATLPIVTPWGKFTARYSEKGLAVLEFPGQKTRVALKRGAVERVPAVVQRWHRAAAAALQSIFAGRNPEQLPPLAPAGTPFQKRVWKALRKISPGKTKSYGAIAQAIGKPKAVRAVGGACGANPIPVLIPCHRVLAANGKLGGFSGGLEWKRQLLAREGVKI